MKVRVLMGFIDKETEKRYFPGERIELTEERVNEILEAGEYIEKLPEMDSTSSDQTPAPVVEKVKTTRKGKSAE